MTVIEGLENLNTAVVESMGCMFRDCSSLKVLDLTSFNIDNLKTAYTMFYGCSSLTTIFCNQDWSLNTELVANSGLYVFTSCTNLVGGKGTKNNNPEVGLAYARPDGGPNSPGLFTMKEAMVYTVFDEATGTLTYRYDDQFDVGNPYVEFYDPVNAPSAVRFTDYNKKVQKAVIDPSMKNANLTSLNSMFYGGAGPTGINALSKMKSIEGLENLNTANVTDMSNMFLGCNAIESLDLTSFDVSKVTDMTFMFNSCYALMTIFCSEDWSTSSALTSDLAMFTASTLLVGGHGTSYNSSKVDKSYARPDGGESKPGYFTMRGDANGDDQVTMTDAVSIVNSILGNPAPGFNKGAANLNGDVDENGEPKVSISDAVGVLNIVKGQ
jgi:surface protein